MDAHFWALVGGIAVLVAVALARRLTDKTPRPLTDEHIECAARAGEAVKAIRWHRQLHGSDLAEAKRAVTEIAREAKP